MKIIYISLLFILVLCSCSKNKNTCNENSTLYFYHNSKIKGENITLRNSFKKIIAQEQDITPKKGFITLHIYVDKYGNFCNQKSYQIDEKYQPVIFNEGKLITKIEAISSNLKGWQNNTETLYLIRLKIEDGKIKEVF